MLKLEDRTIEIRGTQGLLAHRPYAWVPSIKAIVGNIGVFGSMHVRTANTQTVAERAASVTQLDAMAALKPELVIPGHMRAGTKLDPSAIAFTKDYVQTFEKAQTGTRLAPAQNKRGLTTPSNPSFYLWWALSDSNTRPTD